jgi:hypothetical protein
MRSSVNWLWNKLKSLPSYLKISLSLPIISSMMVGSFKIAKVDNDAFLLFKSVTDSIYNIGKKDKIDPELPKKDSAVAVIDFTKLLSKNDSISVKSDSGLVTNIDTKTKEIDHKKEQNKPKPLKPPKESTKIDFEAELARINILYSPALNESSLLPFKTKLLSFCENKISVSDPIESGNVEANINTIKLPIDSPLRRAQIANRIANKLKIRFHSIQHNDANSTILRIGSL